MSQRVDWTRGIESKFPTLVDGCAYCLVTPLPKYRRRYCSDKCGRKAYIEHNIARGNPAVILRQLQLLNEWKCERCKSKTGGEAHHKVAVCEGGGITLDRPEMKLSDYEFLCPSCHKIETADLAKRRALREPPLRVSAETPKSSQLNFLEKI